MSWKTLKSPGSNLRHQIASPNIFDKEQGIFAIGRIDSFQTSWWLWKPVQLDGHPDWLHVSYPLISEYLYMLTHETITSFLHIERYRNGINQGGHPFAMVSMVMTSCDTHLLLDHSPAVPWSWRTICSTGHKKVILLASLSFPNDVALCYQVSRQWCVATLNSSLSLWHTMPGMHSYTSLSYLLVFFWASMIH